MLKTKKGTSIWGADKIERAKLSPDSKTISTLVYNYKPPNLSSAKIIDLETNKIIIEWPNIRFGHFAMSSPHYLAQTANMLVFCMKKTRQEK